MKRIPLMPDPLVKEETKRGIRVIGADVCASASSGLPSKEIS